MPIHLKAKVHKTVVHPIILYGAECWQATTNHEETLHAMELQMLHSTLGLTRLDYIH